MNRLRKSEKRLRLSKETLRTLNAQELGFAGAGTSETFSIAGSLSGSRKCRTEECTSWTC